MDKKNTEDADKSCQIIDKICQITENSSIEGGECNTSDTQKAASKQEETIEETDLKQISKHVGISEGKELHATEVTIMKESDKDVKISETDQEISKHVKINEDKDLDMINETDQEISKYMMINEDKDLDMINEIDQEIPKHVKIDENTDLDMINETAPEISKHVKIQECIEIHEASDTNSESERGSDLDLTSRSRVIRKSSLNTKKEIIGILKQPSSSRGHTSFPSLSNTVLHDLGVAQRISFSSEHLSEQDIENKFSALSLAFKTDRVTLTDRHELQQRQRDLAEKNVSDEIRQLQTTIKGLSRVPQTSDTREILDRINRQISILQQSAGRVASCSEQFGAVQQELRISAVVEILWLHLENIKRNYEREHSELEETRRILIRHKLIDCESSSESGASTRFRSISVIHGTRASDVDRTRRASLASNPNNLSVAKVASRPKSPTFLQMVSARSIASTLSEDLGRAFEKKTSLFRPISEEGKKVSDKNNNNSSSSSSVESRNQEMFERRRESRRQSQFDVDTIHEEMEELATRRDSSPAAGDTRNKLTAGNPRKQLVLPSTPAEVYHRKESLLCHVQSWYSDLSWPFDEEETILGLRYGLSLLLSGAALVVLVSTLFS